MISFFWAFPLFFFGTLAAGLVWVFPSAVTLSLLIGFACLLYFLHHFPFAYRHQVLKTKNIIASPLRGSVVGIIEDERTKKLWVILRQPWWRPWALCLPLSASLDIGRELGKRRVSRLAQVRTLLENVKKRKCSFTTESGQRYELLFFRHLFGGGESLFMAPGDRGLSGALLGVRPFGGLAALVVPESAKVLVVKGDSVHPGKTILASLE